MVARALDVVFPRRCAGCGRGPWPFCARCLVELRPITPPWCVRCGAPSILDVPTCRDCPPSQVTSARAPFRYEGAARTAIHRLKFSGWRDVAGAVAASIAAAPGGLPPVDVVTWVPLARRRLATRGYDQARALAVALGRRLDVPVARLLRRTVATGPQAARSGAERRSAMAGAFTAVRSIPPRVLLVDDVLTTGATVAACADALRAAGAREVHVAALARASGGGRRSTPLRPPTEPAYPG
jgi:ComF family protein